MSVAFGPSDFRKEKQAEHRERRPFDPHPEVSSLAARIVRVLHAGAFRVYTEMELRGDFRIRFEPRLESRRGVARPKVRITLMHKGGDVRSVDYAPALSATKEDEFRRVALAVAMPFLAEVHEHEWPALGK